MTVYFIKNETTFGPFFSTVENAREYLEDPDHIGPDSRIEDILAGFDAYQTLVEVELDDWDQIFDG